MATDTRLDVMLVNPGGRTSIYQSLGSKLAAIEPPVWPGLIATFVRNKGYGVDLLDANALDLAPEEVAEKVGERKPRVVAIVVYGHQPSASTQVMPSAGAIARAVKADHPDTKVVMIGGHVAALPHQTLKEESVDFVASGEGLYTLLDLIEALRANDDDWSKVRGLMYRDNGGVSQGAPAPLLMDLDAEMPAMAWDLLPMERYRAHNWHCFGHNIRQPYASLYTTLGCPYKCSFCCIQAPFKEGERVMGYNTKVNSYRKWSPEKILDQLGYLVETHGVKNVKFADEMFVLNRPHVAGICDGIVERGYDLNIWAYARVDTIKEGMHETLKAAGVNWLVLGIEAANEGVRDGVEKGYAQADIRATIDALSAVEIYVLGNYIFGLPDDTIASMQETLDLSMDLNTEFANFYCAMAYPGSQLYNIAVKEGWRLPDAWGGYSQHSVDTLPLPTKHLSAGEVLRFRDEAFGTYFNNPAYLEKVERIFGAETAQGIREMAGHKLERKYAVATA